MSTGKREKGFTLVELMITISVVAIGLLAYMSGNIAMSQTADGAYEQSVAFYDAQSVLESMRNTAQTGLFPTNVTATYPNNGTVSGFSNLSSESIRIAYVDATATPLDVTATVTWSSRGGTRSMTKSVRTLMTQRL